MTGPSTSFISSRSMTILSELLLLPSEDVLHSSAVSQLQAMTKSDFDHLMTLAGCNHVIVRALQVTLRDEFHCGDEERVRWAAEALNERQSRIEHAIGLLGAICDTFEEEGFHDVTVIKSLDHWPDLGGDIDLYTNAPPHAVCAMMRRRFQARVLPRSWGDRLACKWNFVVPGLLEHLEVHIGRLGQTGELVAFAEQLPGRAQQTEIGGRMFRVPSPPDRLLISTLQRMYRHFYFRLSDIVNCAQLLDSGALDYDALRARAEEAGIWEGVATYLMIVSDYVRQYRGGPLSLPGFVVEAAGFGGEFIYFNRGFLRVPILPHSAKLYGSQLSEMLRRREFLSSVRLGLLPWLATAAVVGHKLTGSDKGIW